jgi:peptidoglycan hydrolase-like protein with peptidoglycan-binding domain
MKVQWALSRRGYYHGPIDGVIGPDRIRAIRAFQEAQGLPATGQIDPNVLRALKLPTYSTSRQTIELRTGRQCPGGATGFSPGFQP